jgi:choloylglycine hydrolase
MLIAAFSLATTPSFACTGISLKAKDGAAIRSRTLEFGFPLQSNVLVVPAGKEFSTALPNDDWHITNLDNYINLSVKDVESGAIGDVKLEAIGSGSGLLGLPGDFTPPSRFVRTAIFSQAAVPNDTAGDAVLAAFHILNQFDIPEGSVQSSAVGGTLYETTEWTTVSDLKNLRWYFRTFADQSIRMVDLKEAIEAAKGEIKTISMEASKQPIANVSANVGGGK